GRITSSLGAQRFSPNPISKLANTAIAYISAQAPNGILFHHAACAYPSEFNTSFIPDTTSARIGVGCAFAVAEAAVQRSSCTLSDCALIWSMSSQFCAV